MNFTTGWKKRGLLVVVVVVVAVGSVACLVIALAFSAGGGR